MHLFWTGFCCNSPSEKKLNSQPTVHALGESPWPLISQKETPLQPPCFYPSLIVTSVTLELRAQSHHRYNPFKDKLSICVYRPEHEAAFCSQLHRCYPQPELAGASLPCFSATSYSMLHDNTGTKHQLQQSRQDTPGASPQLQSSSQLSQLC